MNQKYLSIVASLLILTGCSTLPPTTNVTIKPTPSGTTISTTTTTDTTITPSSTSSTQDKASYSNTVNGVLPQSQQITISNYSFSTASVTVKPGTTVTWTNQDSVSHNITADAASADAVNFGSGTLAQGDTYSYTFNTAGTFNYHCSIHPNMKASVTVAQ